jgi:hypothetical protein
MNEQLEVFIARIDAKLNELDVRIDELLRRLEEGR